ncbi:MAG: hypothetical protein B6U95_03935 [Thermofilum sp. ex4484_82]|nr:MAG: hypothetical protein B6U95_03935 [Thermofilum sp. ex4484_82]OYT38633.1 MAG: hypothetical protein B6U96_03930 [Archaeoglobales archaeon ex4484_92]
MSRSFEFNEIYKAFIVPIRGKNGPQYVKTITAEESKKLFDNLTNLIRKLLERFLFFKGKGKLSTIEELSDFLDFFILFIKGVQYMDIVPEVIPSQVKEFYLSIYYKDYKKKIKLDNWEGIKEYEDLLVTLYHETRRKTKKDLSLEEREETIIEKAFHYPADTRILANVSSLLLHSFVVSGIATCKLIESYLSIGQEIDKEKLVALRLASLFHDFGKYNFMEWHLHEQNSIKFLEELKRDYAEGKAKEIFDLAINIIKGSSELLTYLREADKIASAEDRLKRIFFSLLEMDKDAKSKVKEAAERIGKKLESFSDLDKLYKDWNFWKSLGQSNIRDLSEKFCKMLSKIDVENPIIREMLEKHIKISGTSPEDFLVAKADIRNIQKYIRANDLRTMKGASRIIDTILMISIPYCLHEKFQLPYECFLFYGGGNITFLIAFCGFNFAEKTEKGKYICSLCEKKYKIGENYHYKQLFRKLFGNDPSEDFLKRILEYIGGLDLAELENPEEYLNIALIRMDANIAGQLMSSSISITDAFERSIRIDSSLKKAFHNFLNKVRRKNKDDYNRLVFGVVYMGGDDATLIVPSKLALPLAYNMINEYFLNMGCRSTLSVSITVAKPKHPIIPLYESAGYILDKLVKDNIRESALAIHMEEARLREDFRGALSIFVTEQGIMYPENIDFALNKVLKEKVSLLKEKPFLLSERKQKNSILRYFNLILDKTIDKIDSSISEELLQKIYTSGFKEDLRSLRRILFKNLQVRVEKDNSTFVKVIFAGREEKTGSKETQETIKRMMENLLYMDGDEPIFTLFDLYLVLESLIGGLK